jgi:hypothetical protein
LSKSRDRVCARKVCEQSGTDFLEVGGKMTAI